MNKEWEKRAVLEFKRYWLNALYLACMFGVMTWRQRLLLMEHGISYKHYGIAIIKALVLAKVILIGDALRLGRGLERKPLIYPTIYKSFVFMLFVAAFEFLADTVTGSFSGEGWKGGVNEFREWGPYGFLSRVLMVFVTFIPFFAVRELSRVLGPGRVGKLFFRKRSQDVEFPGGATQPAT